MIIGLNKPQILKLYFAKGDLPLIRGPLPLQCWDWRLLYVFFPLFNILGLRPRASDLPRKHTLTYQTILQSFQKVQDYLWCINKSRHSIRCRSTFNQPFSFNLRKWHRNRCHRRPHDQQRQHMTREWRWALGFINKVDFYRKP